MTEPPNPNPPAPERGRVVAIDYGTKRLGLAVADLSVRIASPLETWQRCPEPVERKRFCKLAETEGVVRFIVGLPVHTDGGESQTSGQARKFGAWLEQVTGVPVVYFDERYTSSEAEDLLLGAQMTRKQRKQRIDRLAASLILSAYFESQRPEGDTHGQSLSDWG